MNITNLLEGEYATIDSCDNKRLMEHGFVKGTPIQIYKKLPNITCIYVRGAIIACRNYDLTDIGLKNE
jgi:Fe2+ transport system protein FeoA